ncbi:MAG: glycine cleavage system protein R [Armatimonadetes bacterium]|nr:glycine cleavage system protein R [Armatimonadota bacterium]
MPNEDREFLVISALGNDRPGIVDEFSEFILARGCNLEDSRMAVLGGDFASIVLVSGNQANIARVRQEIEDLAGKSALLILAKPTTPTPGTTGLDRIPYQVTGTGMDHPGVVHRFSHEMHERGINIAGLDTHSYNAPISGTPLFHFEMVIEVPAEVHIAELRDELNRVADEENVDVQLAPVT